MYGGWEQKKKSCARLSMICCQVRDRERSINIIEGLGLEGVSVKACKTEKGGLAGSEFAILVDGMTEAEHKHAHSRHGNDHDHEHHHHEHVHRGMSEIRQIVDGLDGISDKSRQT